MTLIKASSLSDGSPLTKAQVRDASSAPANINSLPAELSSIRQLEGRDVVGGLRRLVALVERGENPHHLWRNRCFLHAVRRLPSRNQYGQCSRLTLRTADEHWDWGLPQIASWAWYSLDLFLWAHCQARVLRAHRYRPVLVANAVRDPKRLAAVMEVTMSHPEHAVMNPLLRDCLLAFSERLEKRDKQGRGDIPPFKNLKPIWVRMIHEVLEPRLAKTWELDPEVQRLLSEVLLDFEVHLLTRNPEIMEQPLPLSTRLKLLERARLPRSELMLMCHEVDAGGRFDRVRAGLMSLALGTGSPADD